jgi:hypothetical protein
MEPFEDENPFSTADPPLSSASSNSHVDVSAPPSPANLAFALPSSPTTHTGTQSLRGGLPSQGTSRPLTSKSDFCCVRDKWIHSGEDVEILVRIPLSPGNRFYHARPLPIQITDAQKTSENSTSPYITYIIRSGVSLRVDVL